MVTKFVLLSVHETIFSFHLGRLFFPWTPMSSSTKISMVSKVAWIEYLLGKSLLPILMVFQAVPDHRNDGWRDF